MNALIGNSRFTYVNFASDRISALSNDSVNNPFSLGLCHRVKYTVNRFRKVIDNTILDMAI
jgi:hypothetical protein